MPEVRAAEKITCELCPHYCKLGESQYGICGVRKNSNGSIILETYGLVSSYGVDPIEKKPLYHFFPGKKILSIGSYGCNFKCLFCQNHSISQISGGSNGRFIAPNSIVENALDINENIGIAFTYNEPTVWYEYVMDIATLSHNMGLINVMVSNGFINPEPLKRLTPCIDAWNIDLKSFSDDFYHRRCGGTIKPVLKTIEAIAAAGKHLEVTTLIIPGANDSVEEIGVIARWLAENTGPDTPLHISRYFPRYKSSEPATPPETITELYNEARKHLSWVYTGNIDIGHGSDTVCPSCGTVVSIREGYKTSHPQITEDGRCKNCNFTVYRYL